MSSSTEHAAAGTRLASVTPLPVPELRSGDWTRRAGDSALGDTVVEHMASAVAERIKDSAVAQGYAIGWAQGLREAREQVRHEADEARRAERAQHEAAVRGLAEAAEASRARLHAVCAAVEDGAARLAMDVVEALLDRELAAIVDPGEHLVARALALAPAQEGTVHAAPAAVTPDAQATLAEHGLRLVPDPSLGTADVVIDLGEGVVDARISTAVDRLREVLR